MSHLFLNLLADAAAGAPASSPLNTIVPMLCIFAILYFVMIRPASLKQKQLDALIKSVKTGDKVVTSSGIHGLVSNVKESTVILKIADNVKIELEKASIGSVKRDEADTASAS